ncbi:CDC26 family anaphase-promoting complex subunit [Aspergillus novofumigatus IBT 16806]|uniref:Uncharacterized protein n=1 Tax=Aspergillus novofumigatus (strain IBT 16806) TaxID=1392255 RepID=A0A2I1BZX0_ASPN1|nr:uncharacterized protein P174DRAFT_375713 [Aspergillus novofumigatus IBT 16806]PKX90895.1 hypothetical protein P174DRAFT_375713 [Aspergillus novofumigatus IBT 16806]
MLRRKPTAIAITSEDIAKLEDMRLRKRCEETQAQAHESVKSTLSHTTIDPNDELKPLPGDKARIVRSREERIGIGRRN